MTTKRKPYVRGMKATWWKDLGFYKFYMIREGTALPQLWFSVILIYGLFCPTHFITFLQTPWVMVLNGIALAGALLHTATWFNLAPKALRLIVNNKPLPAHFFVIGLWVVTILITIALLAIALKGDCL